MSKYQRQKGARGEREVASLWKEIGFPFARRKLSQYQEKSGVDLENTEPFIVQCKVGKSIHLWKALKEIEENRKKSELPIVMFKRDRDEWIVLMRFSTFKHILMPT